MTDPIDMRADGLRRKCRKCKSISRKKERNLMTDETTRTPAPAPAVVGSDVVEAAQAVIDTAFDYYTARNGKRMSIEGDDGEKCWIVPFDQFENLRAALQAQPAQAQGDDVVERVARIIEPLGWRNFDHAMRPYIEGRGARGDENFWYAITWKRGIRSYEAARDWFLNDDAAGKEGDWPSIVFSVRESMGKARAALAAMQQARCIYCDGTGDVHRADGEWLGECADCAPKQQAGEPLKEAVRVYRQSQQQDPVADEVANQIMDLIDARVCVIWYPAEERNKFKELVLSCLTQPQADAAVAVERERCAMIIGAIQPDEDAAGCPATWGDFVQIAQHAIRAGHEG